METPSRTQRRKGFYGHENRPVPPPPPTPSRPASSASVREDPVEDPFVESPTAEGAASAEEVGSRLEVSSPPVSSPRLRDIFKSPEPSEGDLLCSRSRHSSRLGPGTHLNLGGGLPISEVTDTPRSIPAFNEDVEPQQTLPRQLSQRQSERSSGFLYPLPRAPSERELVIEDLRRIHGEEVLFRTPSARGRRRCGASNPAHQSLSSRLEDFNRDPPHPWTSSQTSHNPPYTSPGTTPEIPCPSALLHTSLSPPLHFGRYISTPVTPRHQQFSLEERFPESDHDLPTPKPESKYKHSRGSPSQPPVYRAHYCDTHQGSHHPLSFAPVTAKGHRHWSSSADITAGYAKGKSSQTRSKSGSFSFSRPFRRKSLESSPEATQTGAKGKLKQASSAILQKIFQSGSHRHSDKDSYVGDDILVDSRAFAPPGVRSEKGKEPVRDSPVPVHGTPHPEVNQSEEQPTPRTVYRQTAFHWSSILHSRVRSKSAIVVPSEDTKSAAEKDLETEELEALSAVPTIEVQEVVEDPHVTQKLSPKAPTAVFPEHLPDSETSSSHSSTMELPRAPRFLDPSSAMASITKQKIEAIKLAKEQAAAVKEMCRRAKSEVPPYEFEELIGKGAYGRVYKGRQLPSRDLVAIKVMEIDSVDYKTIRDMKDESIKDFIQEIKVMNQAKEAGAQNVNMLIEAISIHSQLWVVCEYCPGGSVKTLMRATGDKLDEKFIIPIARDLAEGLRAIHDAGIIHRDVKAANVLIHEEGRLQICDFGVAGILQSKVDKRSTWIGTPHWMPPEMFSTRGGEAHQYGSELDVWAYGCTLYEFATGNPPNAGLRERMQIGRSLGRLTPKLEGDEFSDQLKDLVSFSLNSDPATRPTMGTILGHPYIAHSAGAYPTSSLSELVRIFYQWSQGGGQRRSLFHPGGAVAAEFPDTSALEEDWNFSTTDGFERRFSILDLDQLSASLAELEGEQTPMTAMPDPSASSDDTSAEMTLMEQANFDERVKRGAAAMEGLFNEDKPTYKYETKNDFVPVEQEQRYSDLPLRTVTDRSSVTSTFIDINLGAFDSAHYAAGSVSNHPFQLADANTIRANRSSLRSSRNSNEDHSRSLASSESDQEPSYKTSGPRPPTMDWKFPSMEMPSTDQPESVESPESSAQAERHATRDWKFPVMTEDEEELDVTTHDTETPSHTIRPPHAVTSELDFTHANNLSLDSTTESRPSTATSTVSTTSDYDPFRFDRITSPGLPNLTETPEYAEYQKSILEGPGPDEEEEDTEEDESTTTDDQSAPNTAMSVGEDAPTSPSTVAPNKAMSVGEVAPTSPTVPPLRVPMTAPSSVRNTRRPIPFPEIRPPSVESLMAGADDATVTAELDRLLDAFNFALNSTIEAVQTRDTGRPRHSSDE